MSPTALHSNSSALDERHPNSEIVIVLPGHPIARVERVPDTINATEIRQRGNFAAPPEIVCP